MPGTVHNGLGTLATSYLAAGSDGTPAALVEGCERGEGGSMPPFFWGR